MVLDRCLRTIPLALLLILIGTASAQPTKFHEAPSLTEQVKAGKLPPVDKRLPADPLVVPVVERTGQYGGVWRRAFLGPADANNYVRVVYDALGHACPSLEHPVHRRLVARAALWALSHSDDEIRQI